MFSELLAHEEFVARHPNNKVAALALIDHRLQTYSNDPRMALRAVAAIRFQSRKLKDRLRAERLLNESHPFHFIALICISAALGLQPESIRTVRLTKSLLKPWVSTFPGYPHFNFGGGGECVQCGARWLRKRVVKHVKRWGNRRKDMAKKKKV